jgi:ribosome modulation factor
MKRSVLIAIISGAIAHSKNRSIEFNPYTDKELKQAWRRGWNLSRQVGL